MTARALGLGLAWFAAAASGALADSPSCQQAQVIVNGVAEEYAAGRPDHDGVLRRLATARNLCPSLGEVWRYSYCSAAALGDTAQAAIFQRRASLNGVRDLSCAIAGAASAGDVAAPLGPVREKFALVVGVSRFAVPGVGELRFAAKDAQDLAAALVDPCLGRFRPDNVFTLTDEAATRANILNRLNSIMLQAQPDDLVLLFFSTHGLPSKDGHGLGGLGYLVTYDTDPLSPWDKGLPFEQLKGLTEGIQARRLVTFLDTCYSGQIRAEGGKDLDFEVGGIRPGDAQLLLSGEGSYVVSSSAESEKSWESDELQNGFFTYYLIDALRRQGEAPTLGEVYGELSRKVPTAVAREKGARQTPQLYPENLASDVRIGVAPSAGGGDLAVCTARSEVP